MNDFGMLQELVQSLKSNSALFWALIIFVAINLLASIGNIVLQIVLKNKDNKNYRVQIRETKRMEIYEKIYLNLVQISYYDGRSKNEEMLSGIKNIEYDLSKNSLYISKQTLNLINEFLDYFKSVLTDFRKKNYASEKKYFEDFRRQFNK